MRRGTNVVYTYDIHVRGLMDGAADMNVCHRTISAGDQSYFIGLWNALVASMHNTGAKITPVEYLIRLGDYVIDFYVWCKCLDRKRCWQMSTPRVDLIALFVSAKNKQAAMEILIARLLPQPIAEAIRDDFAGWLHYDIIVNT